MTDTITITGLVATDPRHTITTASLPITSFRLASTQRRFDRAQNKWVDGETNWYTISTFRQLAVNAATSINKGDRVVVTGRVRLRDWQTPDKSGMNVDIEADALGHDLSWGTARWARTSQPQSSNIAQRADSFGVAPGGGDADADSLRTRGDYAALDASSASSVSAAPMSASTSTESDDSDDSDDEAQTPVLAGGADDTPF